MVLAVGWCCFPSMQGWALILICGCSSYNTVHFSRPAFRFLMEIGQVLMEALVICTVASSPAVNLQCDFCINPEGRGDKNCSPPKKLPTNLQLRKATEESCSYKISAYKKKNNLIHLIKTNVFKMLV